MNSSGGRFNTYASISENSRFPISTFKSNLVSNDNMNEELNWGLFNSFNDESLIYSNQNQFLDSPSFPFDSNVSFQFPKKVIINFTCD